MISSKKKEFIVEYRSHSIKAARVNSHGSPIVVESLLHLDGKEPEEAASELRRFSGAKANGYLMGACTVYPEDRFIRRLSIDCPKGKETDFVIDYLQNETRRNPAELKTYCLDATGGQELELSKANKKSVVLCGSPKEEVVAVQKQLLENAIYPNHLEIGTFSMVGLLRKFIAGDRNRYPILYLEVEEGYTNALIVGTNGVEMSRRIESGSKHVAEALKEELSLKDDKAADKLLRSRDFDFGSISSSILRRILRELQSSIGFFEVQTGQSVSRVFCTQHRNTAPWLQKSISEMLNLESCSFDLFELLKKQGIQFADSASKSQLDASWLGLFSILCDLSHAEGSES